MPTSDSIRTVGDWGRGMRFGMQSALAVSMDVMGRTGEEACRHAIILMATSARALTSKSKRKREVQLDARLHGAKFVESWRQGDKEPRKWYMFQAESPAQWEAWKTVPNSGLARRAWMWGLGKLTGKDSGNPIQGASSFFTITRENVNGYVKQNKLSFITKAMPVGWERSVSVAAENRIMAQARKKLQQSWQAEMRRVQRGRIAVARDVGRFFRKVA